jgi:hypothetical protein
VRVPFLSFAANGSIGPPSSRSAAYPFIPPVGLGERRGPDRQPMFPATATGFRRSCREPSRFARGSGRASSRVSRRAAVCVRGPTATAYLVGPSLRSDPVRGRAASTPAGGASAACRLYRMRRCHAVFDARCDHPPVCQGRVGGWVGWEFDKRYYGGASISRWPLIGTLRPPGVARQRRDTPSCSAASTTSYYESRRLAARRSGPGVLEL